MIALLRSTDGNPDSRFEKYENFLNSEAIPYLTICWDRFNTKIPSNKHLYYKRKSEYSLRFKNIVGLLGFNWFIFKSLLKHRKEYKIIHAADFDTIIPAIIMKLLFQKKVIYDIYDWYIDSRSIKNSLLKSFVKQIERINIKKSDVVIICEEGRKEQIIYEPKKIWVLPNIPSLETEDITYSYTEPLKISYVGILGGGRGLKNLIRLAQEKPQINFIIGGFGALEEDFKQAASLPNVTYKGRVSYKEALRTMADSDIIYAMYERINPNHILAAPNKYYEGLALGRPVITTIGTLVGDKVMAGDTGYCIDEKYGSLENLVDNFDIQEQKNKAVKAKKLWQEKYQNYVRDFMNGTYLPFILLNQ